MKLNALQSKILTPFVTETIQALQTMAGLSAYAGDGFPDALDKFRFKGYAVAAETSGVVQGTILMHHYIETALAIGNKVRENLLGITDPATTIDEDIGEALAEFSNTIIGLAMRDLDRANMGIRFKPPYFVSSLEDMNVILHNVQEIISIPIHVENVGRFYFNYLLHSKTGS